MGFPNSCILSALASKPHTALCPHLAYTLLIAGLISMVTLVSPQLLLSFPNSGHVLSCGCVSADPMSFKPAHLYTCLEPSPSCCPLFAWLITRCPHHLAHVVCSLASGYLSDCCIRQCFLWLSQK